MPNFIKPSGSLGSAFQDEASDCSIINGEEGVVFFLLCAMNRPFLMTEEKKELVMRPSCILTRHRTFYEPCMHLYSRCTHGINATALSEGAYNNFNVPALLFYAMLVKMMPAFAQTKVISKIFLKKAIYVDMQQNQLILKRWKEDYLYSWFTVADYSFVGSATCTPNGIHNSLIYALFCRD